MCPNPINEKLDTLIKDAHARFMTLSASCPTCSGTLNAVFAEDVGKFFQVTLRCDNTECFYEVVIKVLPAEDFELVSLSNDDSSIFYGEIDEEDDD